MSVKKENSLLLPACHAHYRRAYHQHRADDTKHRKLLVHAFVNKNLSHSANKKLSQF